MAQMMLLAGTAISAVSTIAQGQQDAASADYQAKQQRQAAKMEIATSQRQMQEERKREQLAQSNLQSAAGATGFLATDDTVADLAGAIAARGELQAQDALFGGRERAAGRINQARATKWEGQQAKTASYFKAASTIMQGVGSYGQKTGMFQGAPKTPTDPWAGLRYA